MSDPAIKEYLLHKLFQTIVDGYVQAEKLKIALSSDTIFELYTFFKMICADGKLAILPKDLMRLCEKAKIELSETEANLIVNAYRGTNPSQELSYSRYSALQGAESKKQLVSSNFSCPPPIQFSAISLKRESRRAS